MKILTVAEVIKHLDDYPQDAPVGVSVDVSTGTVFIREEIQNRNSCFKIDNPILTFLKLTIINHNYKDDVQEFNLFCWSLGEPGDTDSYFTNRDAGLYWKKPILLNQPENDNWI